MTTRVAPPPERFVVRRAGEADRLAPAVAVPAPPETADDPVAAPSPATPEPVPADGSLCPPAAVMARASCVAHSVLKNSPA